MPGLESGFALLYFGEVSDVGTALSFPRQLGPVTTGSPGVKKATGGTRILC